MKTSLSAALFSLPETTNSAETGGKERASAPPGAPLTSCADETIGWKRTVGFGARRSRDGRQRHRLLLRLLSSVFSGFFSPSHFWISGLLPPHLSVNAARSDGGGVGGWGVGGVKDSVSRVCQARSKTPSGISYAKNVSSAFR